MKNNQSLGFLTKLYHFWGAHLDEEEFSFYEEMLQGCSGGQALELSCGSGRLLLPFLQKGYLLEGVESSKELIDLLNIKLQKVNVKPKIYQQKLEELDLKDNQYDLIFIPLGSLQLMSDPEEVEYLLKKLKRYLREGGKAVFSLFLPFSGSSFESENWRIVTNVLSKATGMRKVSREKIVHDPVEQVIFGKVRFETWQGKDLFEFQEKDLFVRWYSKGEFNSMLKSAGFKNISVRRTYKKGGAVRPAFMLFIAE